MPHREGALSLRHNVGDISGQPPQRTILGGTQIPQSRIHLLRMATQVASLSAVFSTYLPYASLQARVFRMHLCKHVFVQGTPCSARGDRTQHPHACCMQAPTAFARSSVSLTVSLPRVAYALKQAPVIACCFSRSPLLISDSMTR